MRPLDGLFCYLSVHLPMSMASSINIRPRLVDFRVYREGRGIDGLIPDHDVAIFVDENEVAHTDLAEMLRQWVQPEVICKDRVANADMASNAFVEASLCEDAVCCCEMPDRFERSAACE